MVVHDCSPALWRQENCKLEDSLGCSTVNSGITWDMQQDPVFKNKDGGDRFVFRTGNLAHTQSHLTKRAAGTKALRGGCTLCFKPAK